MILCQTVLCNIFYQSVIISKETYNPSILCWTTYKVTIEGSCEFHCTLEGANVFGWSTQFISREFCLPYKILNWLNTRFLSPMASRYQTLSQFLYRKKCCQNQVNNRDNNLKSEWKEGFKIWIENIQHIMSARLHCQTIFYGQKRFCNHFFCVWNILPNHSFVRIHSDPLISRP